MHKDVLDSTERECKEVNKMRVQNDNVGTIFITTSVIKVQV